MTSIFGVFQNDIVAVENEDSSWTQIYYDFESPNNIQESKFTAIPENPEDIRYFPINTFFDTVEYRKATKNLSDSQQEEIDKVQAVFKETDVPVQSIETDDRDKVGIVFERVNRLGVALDTFQLLAAWTWSEEFDLQNKFKELGERLQDFGFEEVGEDSDLILRCAAAVIKNEPNATALLSITGEEIRTHFPTIEKGIAGAIDHIKKEFNIATLKNLPYATILIPLSVFYASDKKYVNIEDSQRAQINTWFWKTCFAARYSAGVQRNLKTDIDNMIKLKHDANSTELTNFSLSLSESYFTENKFLMNTVKTKTFILLLTSLNPKSFLSGKNVDLDKVLERYNRKEFHHVFPKKYLENILDDNGNRIYSDKSINSLANFAIISSADNLKILKKSPAEYVEEMPSDQDRLNKILDASMIPNDFYDLDFDSFISKRVLKLIDYAKKLTAI